MVCLNIGKNLVTLLPYMNCRRGKKKNDVNFWMNYILQHKDVNYQCKISDRCPFVGQKIVVKESMGEQHDTSQLNH